MSTGNHEVRIGFTGDISFTGVFRERVLNEYEITRYIDTKIIECLAKNDWNVGNIEGPITLVNTPNSAGVALKSPPEVAKVLRRLKINCYNLANNHIMDYGVLGLRDTLDFAYQNDAVPMGAGVDISYASRPVVFEKYDIKLGLLSISHNEGMLATDKKPGVFAERSDELILERIRWLRSCCDWVIINYHGGEEYTFVPSPLRRHRLLRYLNYGADIIIAHHPHVVQGYEQVGNKRIFYSLGNFIFDIPEHSGCKGTDQSVIISLIFKKKSFEVVTLYTKSNLSIGRVGAVSMSLYYSELLHDVYLHKWEQEAFRIISDQFRSTDYVYRSLLAQMFSTYMVLMVRRALGVMRRLKNPIFRNMILSACKYQLANLFRRSFFIL